MSCRNTKSAVVLFVSFIVLRSSNKVFSLAPSSFSFQSGRCGCCTTRRYMKQQEDDAVVDLTTPLITKYEAPVLTTLPSPTTAVSSRRDMLASFFAFVTLSSVVPTAALAFDNRISTEYDNRPKIRGAKPKDLGVATRISLTGDEYLGLKPCGAAPNCFCSTMSVEEDPEHSIPAWTWPETLSVSIISSDNSTGVSDSKLTMMAAFEQLYQVLQSYPPGQSGVDGGGCQLQKYDASAGYIYIIYEALKNGYYDDVEFAYIRPTNGKDSSSRQIQVRSSSRVGYLDFGVNAKRLNWIAKELRKKGWDAPGVDYATHRVYALENQR